jgi:hypothetical protein
MTLMYDDPDGVHALMAWLRDEHLAMLEWAQREGVLTSIHLSSPIGSGGYGPTESLGPYRFGAEPMGMVGFAESQETVGVSPKLFARFILPYQIPLLDRFGLNYYGCCEPLHQRIEHVLAIPRLRFLSSSPWCDDQRLAQRLGRDYVIMKKPNPAPVCVGFNETAIRTELRQTLAAMRSSHLAFVLKDTHTIEHRPERLGHWVRIAREEIDAALAAGAPA